MHELDKITWAMDETGSPGPARSTTGDLELAVLRDAHRLLELHRQQELGRFLSGILRSSARRVGAGLRTDVRAAVQRSLMRGLGDVGRAVLPVAGRSFGAWVEPGGDARGVAETARLAERLGLPAEGLSTEDQEYEIALAYVRFAHRAADDAFRQASRLGAAEATRRSLREARREHLPAARLRRGTWQRDGREFVLHGL